MEQVAPNLHLGWQLYLAIAPSQALIHMKSLQIKFFCGLDYHPAIGLYDPNEY